MNYKNWCWRCGKLRNERLGIKIFISRKGKCFYCRIDYLDKKYGPSDQAKQFGCPPAALTLWEQKKYKLALRLLIK